MNREKSRLVRSSKQKVILLPAGRTELVRSYHALKFAAVDSIFSLDMDIFDRKKLSEESIIRFDVHLRSFVEKEQEISPTGLAQITCS